MKTGYRPMRHLAASCIMASLCIVPSASAQTEVAELTASDAAANSLFGYSVSLDGERAVIGATGEDDRSGAAYVFERQAGAWTEIAKLKASDAVANNFFGANVSLDGDRAVVAALLDDHAGTAAGSAYVFELQAGAWTEQAKITASDAAANNRFGSSLSLDGSRALVGAYENHGGAAYVFELQAGAWTEVAKLTASDAVRNVGLGISVSLDGDRAIVEQNYPNPFNPVTTLAYQVPEASAVRLVVYNVLGRPVRELIDSVIPAGRQKITFEAGDLPSGLYLMQLSTPKGRFTQKMLLQK